MTYVTSTPGEDGRVALVARMRLHYQVIQELRSGLRAGDEEVITRTRAGDVQEVALGVVNFLQVRIVGNSLNTLLQRDNLVITGHNDYRPEL